MIEAIAWGLVASASLLIGGALTLWRPVSQRTLGLIMAFGAGVLISSVAFELVQEAFETSGGDRVALGLLAGALAFYVGDAAIDQRGGAARKHSGGNQASGSGLAIVLGIVLDGVPESIVLGLSLLGGTGVSLAFLAGVFLSNLPEAMAASAGLATSGWPRAKILALWLGVMLVSGVAAGLGYALAASASPSTVALVLSFAGGAILTMLADTMMPEAFEHGGRLVGVLTTIGFAVAFGLSMAG